MCAAFTASVQCDCIRSLSFCLLLFISFHFSNINLKKIPRFGLSLKPNSQLWSMGMGELNLCFWLCQGFGIQTFSLLFEEKEGRKQPIEDTFVSPLTWELEEALVKIWILFFVLFLWFFFPSFFLFLLPGKKTKKARNDPLGKWRTWCVLYNCRLC